MFAISIIKIRSILLNKCYKIGLNKIGKKSITLLLSSIEKKKFKHSIIKHDLMIENFSNF